MTRIFMTGCEQGDLNAFDSTVNWYLYSDGGRSGTYYCGAASNANNIYARKALPAAYSELYARVGHRPVAGGNSRVVFSFFDSAGAYQLTFLIDANWQVEVRRGDRTGTIIATGGTITAGVWQCWEPHVIIADSGGVVQVKIDGTLVIDFTGDSKYTGNANVQTLQLGSPGTNYPAVGFYDDIAINDTAGTVNNGWIGRGGIYPVKPTGAGTYAELTPSAGANWQCVDDVPPNDDTDYVASGVVDEKDTYALSDLVQTAGTITAVQWVARARLEDAGAGSLARLFRIAAADYQGDDKAIDTTSYRYLQEIVELNPSDSEPWDIADINAMEAGEVIR